MAKEVVKMRVNYDKNSICQGCSTKWKNTAEMYDMMLCGKLFTLCFDCVDKVFHKTLSANCKYNHRVKSQEDLQRASNAREIQKGVKNA